VRAYCVRCLKWVHSSRGSIPVRRRVHLHCSRAGFLSMLSQMALEFMTAVITNDTTTNIVAFYFRFEVHHSYLFYVSTHYSNTI
jgi:hypothetical protein